MADLEGVEQSAKNPKFWKTVNISSIVTGQSKFRFAKDEVFDVVGQPFLEQRDRTLQVLEDLDCFIVWGEYVVKRKGNKPVKAKKQKK